MIRKTEDQILLEIIHNLMEAKVELDQDNNNQIIVKTGVYVDEILEENSISPQNPLSI